jgi:hypothetical protein
MATQRVMKLDGEIWHQGHMWRKIFVQVDLEISHALTEGHTKSALTKEWS